MPLSKEQKELFLRTRSENLSTEIKSKIDLSSEDGVAVLVKACQAIYNRNGGHLLIGFDDDGKPEQISEENLNYFTPDKIQDQISRYSSPKFEIGLDFLDIDGQKYPIVSVPNGVRYPVHVCKDLASTDGKKHLTRDTVFFRTLNSSGIASTAPLSPRDFPQLLDICFQNRETDIASFIRRHLSDLTSHLENQSTDLRAKLDEEVAKLNRHFSEEIARSEVPKIESWLLTAATLRFVVVCDPPLAESGPPGQSWLNAFFASNPNLTGWPIFMDTRGFSGKIACPKARANGWNILIPRSAWGDGLEFFRIEQNGQLYFQRVLQDDTSNKIPRGTELDPILLVLRIAEAITVTLEVLKASGAGDSHSAYFRFVLSGLDGRRLSNWANPMRLIRSRQSNDNNADADITLSVLSSTAQVSAATTQVANRLLFPFDGFEFDEPIVSELLKKLLERRL